MKGNLENKITEAFNEFEMPYNPKAWTALSQQLDKVQPVTPKTGGGNLLAWSAGIAAAVITTAVVLLWNKSDEQIPEKRITVENKATNNATENQAINSVNNKSTVSSKSTPISDNTALSVEKTPAVKENTTTATQVEADKKTIAPIEKTVETITPTSVVLAPVIKTPKSEASFILPVLNNVYCKNETINIENKNESDLVVVAPNGKETKIAAKKTTSITAIESGEYLVYSAKNATTTKSFIVKESKVVDFTVYDEEKYSNGLPSIQLEAANNGTNYEWIVEGLKEKKSGKTTTVHLYNKGTYHVTLKARNLEGCESIVTKNVYIDEDYNLLAPSAFMPLSSDRRKNTFIPYALLERNTGFKLTIIHPKSGFTLFETTSTEGWNGVDMNTNQLVDFNYTYIWKVTLTNPEPGEKSEYKGVVTMLQQ
jgi:hypothetical protein